MLSERRTNFFLNEHVNDFLPPFINLGTPGLNLSLQGLQFVATSTTADNQTLAFPHYVHSISTNGDNQDVVSMGTDAALFTAKVIENAYTVLSIEAITLCQAIDYLKEKDKLSKASTKFVDSVRNVFPVVTTDRVIVNELQKTVELLKEF